jgi:hypothetical protein
MDESFGGGRPVRATIPTAPGRGKPHGTPGRTCSHPGCTTVLSVYNASRSCWTHQDDDFTIRSERFSRTAPPAAGRRVTSPAA